MSIGKKNKDHLEKHASVSAEGGELPEPPKSDDPLYFWTNHPTENYAVNLRPFANGVFENPHPSGKNAGMWKGTYSGRPNLIAELAPAIQASLTLLGRSRAIAFESTLRAWWRLFDSYENTTLANGQSPPRVEVVADLNELHETFAHQQRISTENFRTFVSSANATRKILKLPLLLWEPPKSVDPTRTLIPDDQAKELKTALKQDWERVRKTWTRNDAIREEAARQASGETARFLDDEEAHLLKNWQHFERVQQKTGLILPTSKQLLDGKLAPAFCVLGLERKLMRSLLFPTVEEADIAFHMALINSGWNPSTLAKLDAESPYLVTPHPKDRGQLVLTADLSFEPQDKEKDKDKATLQASKARARGKMQFCTGLVKHTSSTPFIVAAYLKRVAPLRELLKKQYAEATKKLGDMRNRQEDRDVIKAQYLKAQDLREGCFNVWLYVNPVGDIRWLRFNVWNRYRPSGYTKTVSYLSLAINRLNAKRTEHGKIPIAEVTISDFRDIYARWVYKRSGGNILSVMLALGHSNIASTIKYVENNIFSTENDAHALRFMTHLVGQLREGRIDLTILSQLLRYGALTPDMEDRLNEYRRLLRSRIGVGCTNPRTPPEHIAPNHVTGRLCGTNRCLKDCENAKFLPESLDGIAMRYEELLMLLERLPRETYLSCGFDSELESGEYLLDTLYPSEAVGLAREKWRKRIASGMHLVPGLGHLNHDQLLESA